MSHLPVIAFPASRGQLPAELAAYNMHRLLHGGLHAAVCDRDELSPTRNTASRGRPSAWRSACSIVAEALEVAHLKMGEKAVEAIWGRLGNAMPTVKGWASAS